MNKLSGFFRGVWALYVDGFRQMTWGRVLWAIVLVKLLVMFLVLRVFFSSPRWPAWMSMKSRKPWAVTSPFRPVREP